MCWPQISRCVRQSLSVPVLDHLYHRKQPTWICRIQQQWIQKLTKPPFIFSFSHILHDSFHMLPISLFIEIVWTRVWSSCIVILLFVLYLKKKNYSRKALTLISCTLMKFSKLLPSKLFLHNEGGVCDIWLKHETY